MITQMNGDLVSTFFLLLRVARRIVQAGKLVLAVVGPDVQSEELAELLAATAD